MLCPQLLRSGFYRTDRYRFEIAFETKSYSGAVRASDTFDNGATLLTIPVGHTLAALRDAFGDIAEVSSVLAVRPPTALVVDTGETLPVTAGRAMVEREPRGLCEKRHSICDAPG